MATVPDTDNFSLQDVVDVVNPTTDDLADCFSDATAALFDYRYQGIKDRLSNFRNYGVEGIWTYRDNDVRIGHLCYGVATDGVIIASVWDDGLRTNSIDGYGVISAVLDTYGSTVFYDIWYQSGYFYVAADTYGIVYFSIDGSGNISYNGAHDAGGSYLSVSGDGSDYIYAVRVDSSDYILMMYNEYVPSGVIDSYNSGGTYLKHVCYAGSNLYAAGADGLYKFTWNGTTLAYVTKYTTYSLWQDVIEKDDFVIGVTSDNGIMIYSNTGTYLDSYDVGGVYGALCGHDQFIAVVHNVGGSSTPRINSVISHKYEDDGDVFQIDKEDRSGYTYRDICSIGNFVCVADFGYYNGGASGTLLIFEITS